MSLNRVLPQAKSYESMGKQLSKKPKIDNIIHFFSESKWEKISVVREELRKLNELKNDFTEHTQEMKNSKTRKEMKFTLEETKCKKIFCHRKRQWYWEHEVICNFLNDGYRNKGDGSLYEILILLRIGPEKLKQTKQKHKDIIGDCPEIKEEFYPQIKIAQGQCSRRGWNNVLMEERI